MSNKIKSEKLVFILGAGASAHFGYPLGNELVSAIGKLITEAKRINERLAIINGEEIQKAQNFFRDIESYNPLNIDYYFYTHPDQEKMGKKLLEAVLLYSQNKNVFQRTEEARKWWKAGFSYPAFERRSAKSEEPDHFYFPAWNWVKFIHHKIVANCQSVDDVKKELEDLSFITFNYDLSFEQALWRYFKGTKFEDVKDYLFNIFFQKNVLHIYGAITRKDDNWKPVTEDFECPDFSHQKTDQEDLAKIFLHSDGKNIHVIGGLKSKENPRAQKAQDFLKHANKVYFLGYALDEFNNQALDLDNVLKQNQVLRDVFYTNLDNSLTCDSRIRGCFDGSYICPFEADGRITQAHVKRKDQIKAVKINISKSTKNVYQALEKDLAIPILKK
jgi:hypothetical protein